MTMQSATGRSRLPSEEMQSLAVRQLRHHTRNALQRVLIEIHDHAAGKNGSRDRGFLERLEERIIRSVEISDALFSVTREPDPFPDRLAALCRGMVALLGDPEQQLQFDMSICGTCPPELETPVLRAAREFLGNAIKHGMHVRLVGRISVSLTCRTDIVELVVADDGWGLAKEQSAGQGLAIARNLARQFGGTLEIERRDGKTVAIIVLRTRSDADAC
jgi:two-component sensor histidine kinase